MVWREEVTRGRSLRAEDVVGILYMYDPTTFNCAQDMLKPWIMYDRTEKMYILRTLQQK